MDAPAAPDGGELEALAAAEHAFVERLSAAASVAELEGILREATGRRSAYARAYERLRQLPADRRRDVGRVLQQWRQRLEAVAAERREALAAAEERRRLEEDRLDLTEVLPAPGAGHLHIVERIGEELEDIFLGMGYEVAEGPELETDWYNFQALNIGPDHPARSAVDTFFVDAGPPGELLLRTHTSPVQVHLLERGRLPIYAVAPGRVYRRDTPDASHLPVFHQIEGLVVDRGVSFGDLAGTIDAFVKAIFGESVSTRLRPAYFPFTEPSAEFEISCTICGGSGCRTCAQTGWIELGGCGMVHPAVLEACGVDPEVWTGFAFGFGVDRLAIMRHGIADIRVLVENDVRFLRQL
jgi:phenylalanyl-tRNA synthetase alpha chain